MDVWSWALRRQLARKSLLTSAEQKLTASSALSLKVQRRMGYFSQNCIYFFNIQLLFIYGIQNVYNSLDGLNIKFQLQKMGQNNTSSRISLSTNYSKISTFEEDYFGQFDLIHHLAHNEPILHKQIIFYQNKEAQEVIKKFQQINKTAFYVLYPQTVQPDENEGICSKTSKLHVYFKNRLQTLQSKVIEVKQTGKEIKEYQIWFILTQLSRSLQILHEQRHAHMWVSPETIFFNKNQNWFLYDTYFICGPDFESFIKDKFKKKKIISEGLKKSIQKNSFNLEELFDEDVYCLGFVMMYLMTGSYPQFNIGKYEIKSLIINCFSSYSKKLVRLVQAMTEEVTCQRISLKVLREKLKEDERNIIMQESQEFKKIKHDRRQRVITNQQHTRIESNYSPPIHGKVYTRKRSFFLSPADTRSREFQSPTYNNVRRNVPQFNLSKQK